MAKEIIVVPNFQEFNILEVTELTADVAEGATSLPVKNEDNFDTDHVVLIGDPGTETAEIKTPSLVADEAITVPALDHPHVKGEKVYKLRANKIRVYKATNVDGSIPSDPDDYSLVTTVTIPADDLETEAEDSDGGSGYWYIFTYYNDIPTTPVETDKIVSDAFRGGGYGRYTTEEEVRREAGFSFSEHLEAELVMSKILLAEGIVKGKISKRYTLPLAYIPELIREVTTLLAAGYLLKTSYGNQELGTNNEGKQKIDEAMKILNDIVAGKVDLLGLDEIGIAEEETDISGFPDDTTADTDDKRNFTWDQEF